MKILTKAQTWAAVLATTMLGMGAVSAAPLAAGDFGTLQADTISTVAVAAGIGVAIMVVSLGWDVGLSLVKKFVKRGAK